MTGHDHKPGTFAPAQTITPINQAIDTPGADDTLGADASPMLTGGTAPVRELLLALSVGGFSLPSPLPDSLCGADGLGHPPGGLDSIIAAAKDTGLLLPDGTVVGTARYALLKGTPTARIRALQRELVDKTLHEGQALGDLARELARSGFQDPPMWWLSSNGLLTRPWNLTHVWPPSCMRKLMAGGRRGCQRRETCKGYSGNR